MAAMNCQLHDPVVLTNSYKYFCSVASILRVVSVLTLLCLSSEAGPGSNPGGTPSCPAACFCNAPSRIVYCSRRGLTAVPDGVAADSLQLNLNGNVFQSTTLRRGNFSGLTALEHLYLSECGIERLEVGTFADLVQLRWLDLSNNRIKALADRTFYGLALQHLFLNGNRHVDLRTGSFEGLVTTGLYLHDCSLVRLTASVLGPLNSTLRYLWLNGNELGTVDVGLRSQFTSLSHLRLGSNPLHCNCETAWLKDFFDAAPDTFRGAAAPSCLTPQRLRGRFFSDLSPADFRCQAPAFSNIETAFGADAGGARLRCTATGDPAPTLYWIQPSGKTTRYAPPADDEAKRNEGLLAVRDTTEDMASLYGMYICVANNEAGNVTLTINVSWPFGGMPREPLTTTQSSLLRPEDVFVVPPGPRGSVTQRSFTTAVNRSNSLVVLPTVPVRQRSPSSNVDDPLPPRGGSAEAAGQRTNYTVIDVTGPVATTATQRPRLFTVTELVCAIIGTHLGTLALCLIALPFLYRRRRWLAEREKRDRAAAVSRLQPPAYGTTTSTALEKPLYRQPPTLTQPPPPSLPPPLPPLPSAESVYLNGTPYSTVRRHQFLTDYLLQPQR